MEKSRIHQLSGAQCDDFGADPTRPVGVDCSHESVGTSAARTNRFEIAGSCKVPQCFSPAVVNPEYRREAYAAQGRIS